MTFKEVEELVLQAVMEVERDVYLEGRDDVANGTYFS
ncbi:hypothetical protein MJ1HA_2106 [Metallosphaera sedula]|nr:hypothetical protein MJ1HA_2106 [Metallosphaera sedula]